MRKKLPKSQKRDQIIGIKVTEETKTQLKFIANRECTSMSTTIDKILQEYIDTYIWGFMTNPPGLWITIIFFIAIIIFILKWIFRR